MDMEHERKKNVRMTKPFVTNAVVVVVSGDHSRDRKVFWFNIWNQRAAHHVGRFRVQSIESQ